MGNIAAELDYENGVCVTFQHDLDKVMARKRRKADRAEQKKRKEIHDRIPWLMQSPYMETNGGHLIHRGVGKYAKYTRKHNNKALRHYVDRIDDHMSGYDFWTLVNDEEDDFDSVKLCYPENDAMLYQHGDYRKALEYQYMLF